MQLLGFHSIDSLHRNHLIVKTKSFILYKSKNPIFSFCYQKQEKYLGVRIFFWAGCGAISIRFRTDLTIFHQLYFHYLINIWFQSNDCKESFFWSFNRKVFSFYHFFELLTSTDSECRADSNVEKSWRRNTSWYSNVKEEMTKD